MGGTVVKLKRKQFWGFLPALTVYSFFIRNQICCKDFLAVWMALEIAISFKYSYLSRHMTKPTKWHVCPVMTQISLGICPVWSQSLLCAVWVAKDPLFLQLDSEDWPDWMDVQAALTPLGAQVILLVFSRCGLNMNIYRILLYPLLHGCVSILIFTECEDGYYGRNCTEKCGNCKDDAACDKYTGHCIMGCVPGFVDSMCLQVGKWLTL